MELRERGEGVGEGEDVEGAGDSSRDLSALGTDLRDGSASSAACPLPLLLPLLLTVLLALRAELVLFFLLLLLLLALAAAVDDLRRSTVSAASPLLALLLLARLPLALFFLDDEGAIATRAAGSAGARNGGDWAAVGERASHTTSATSHDSIRSREPVCLLSL